MTYVGNLGEIDPVYHAIIYYANISNKKIYSVFFVLKLLSKFKISIIRFQSNSTLCMLLVFF